MKDSYFLTILLSKYQNVRKVELLTKQLFFMANDPYYLHDKDQIKTSF